MKKYVNLGLVFLLGIFTVIYFYYLTPLSLDGIWNYGFAYNISSGLVPYKDFNMIIPPLFPWLVSLFICVFGNHYIIYYLVIAIIMVGITVITYKQIGYSAILIYMIILVNPHNGYNTFSLLLLFFLLNLKDNKNGDILSSIIISLMFLTKQTLGLLIIPGILYAKRKKKCIYVYLVFGLSLLLYLLLNNSFMEFIDYCFLGMLDFTSDNVSKLSILTYVEVVICLLLLIKLLKSNFRDKDIFYILLFQVISFPITDNYHFVITISPVIYYIFCNYCDYKYILVVLGVFILSFSLTLNIPLLDMDGDYVYINKSSFINYKRIPNYMTEFFSLIEKYRDEYPNYRLYIFDTRAYIAKMEFGLDIDKYDLINNGNMGYNGSDKYIKEIDNYCKENKCLFIVNEEEVFQNVNQTNNHIVEYVYKNYYKLCGSNIDSVYVN